MAMNEPGVPTSSFFDPYLLIYTYKTLSSPAGACCLFTSCMQGRLWLS